MTNPSTGGTTGRRAVLGQNQYGKAETRVVRLSREGSTHHIKDLNVSIALSGDMDDAHYSGSNTSVLPTDTAKNTVYAFAKTHGIESAEQFAILLARHFVTRPTIHRARVRVEQYTWQRIETPGDGRHSFVRDGQETRVAQITFDGRDWQILSGLKDLVVMNTTDSAFRGFDRDEYTTLRETDDRILATRVSARWRHRWSGGTDPLPHWDASYGQARAHLLEAFADTYSRSLQQTMYLMGARIIENSDHIDEIRLSLPNKHHFLVDLAPFGMENDTPDGAVYFAADRPYGLIEATVLRDGAEQRIPTDQTTL